LSASTHPNSPEKGTCSDKNPENCHSDELPHPLNYQREDFEVKTLQEALVAYKTYARAEGKSPKTVAWISSSITYFAAFLGPDLQDIGRISTNDLRRFIIALQNKRKFSDHPFNKPLDANLSPHSIDNYCRGVKAFFSFLKREDFIQTNPFEKVKLPKLPELVIPTFSQKEMQSLLAQPDKKSGTGFRDFALMLTLYDSGARLSEIANLQTGDIDYDQNLLRVMGKGRKQRYIPFGKKVAKALMKYQHQYRPEPVSGDYFWLRSDGKPLSAGRIQKLITKYGKKAGLARCYAHKLRHTSSVTFLRNGGGEFALQKKLGHRSLLMTRHYSNLSNEDVRDQHLRYGVADKLDI
jgi:site-specific recombinase XerD